MMSVSIKLCTFKIRLLMFGALFSSLLCHLPSDLQAQNRSKASRYYQQGIQALNNYNFREAVQLLSRALRYDSTYTTAFSKEGLPPTTVLTIHLLTQTFTKRCNESRYFRQRLGFIRDLPPLHFKSMKKPLQTYNKVLH
ncbi:MAG: hypothetical protein ACFB0B_06170 [Thermonemataceae bacterium]